MDLTHFKERFYRKKPEVKETLTKEEAQLILKKMMLDARSLILDDLDQIAKKYAIIDEDEETPED